MVRSMYKDKHKVKDRELSQIDNVVREGVMTTEQEYKLLEKAGMKWSDFISKNFNKEQLIELAKKRKPHISNMDFREDFERLDYVKDLAEELKKNKEELEILKQERENVENEINALKQQATRSQTINNDN